MTQVVLTDADERKAPGDREPDRD